MADEQTKMHRRDVLKKAAAAGAVVWTAPLITSSPVLAGPVATAKCAGNTLVCFKWIRNSGSSPNSCSTFTMYSMELFNATSTCPCTPVGGVKKNEPGCIVYPSTITFRHTDGTLATSSSLQSDGGFTVTGVKPGLWTSTTTMYAVSSCLDRDGDKVWYECEYTIRFQIGSGTSGCETVAMDSSLGPPKVCQIRATSANPPRCTGGGTNFLDVCRN
jgi:hypothetical protein